MQASAAKQDIDITEHMGLVYHVLLRYDVRPGHRYWDDFFSAGQYGLTKAWVTFKPEKKTQFASYACTCIFNEINQFLRKAKQFSNLVSLCTEYRINDSSGDTILLADMLPDKRSLYDAVEVRDALSELLAGNYLTPVEKKIVRILILNPSLRQAEVGKLIGYEQSYVSRLLIKLRQKFIARGLDGRY